jgi:hypothetical protein
MAIKRTFNGATIIKPGAYSKVIVENLTGFPLQATNVVGIVGESVGGEPRVIDILSTTQIQDAKQRYKEGPIADALELLVNPSNDPRIVNGASTVVVYKTNNSTRSQFSLENANSDAVVDLASENWGADENNLNVLVSAGAILDANANIEGSVAGNYNLAGGETLIVNANGTNYTFTGTLVGAAITPAALVADMNNAANWAPAKPVVAEIHDTDKIKITIDPSVVVGAELDYGFLVVDAASTLDTIVGITGEARGKKGSRIVTLKKGVQEEVSLELGGQAVMSVKYVGVGTAATLSIKDVSGERVLSTDVTGAVADNLSIVLQDVEGRNKFTIKDLVDKINAMAAYEAAVLGNGFQNANELDFYDEIEIIDVAAVLQRDVFALVDYINTLSLLATAEKKSNVYRAVATFSNPVFFAGATDGSSLNSDFANGFEAMKQERVNVVVPLISKDIGALTIDAINILADNHAKWGWSTLGKSERQAYVSRLGSKDELKEAAQALQSQYSSMVGQQVRVLNRFSELEWKDPWAMACILAGLQAGSETGEPITYKIINVNDVRVFDGSWDPRRDFAEMIEAGVTFTEPLDSGGHRVVVGNTTYGVDANFVFNRSSVVEAAGFVAYDLRFNLELVFTGTKARTGTAEAVANFIRNRMSAYLNADIIVGDDLNDGLGYKNLRVLIEGNTALINVSITPVQGIDFILPTIYLADIRQSA